MKGFLVFQSLRLSSVSFCCSVSKMFVETLFGQVKKKLFVAESTGSITFRFYLQPNGELVFIQLIQKNNSMELAVI